MGFKRSCWKFSSLFTNNFVNCQVKALSNQKINKRYYSNNTILSNSKIQELNINPWFITGFTDAEGCFSCTIRKNPKAIDRYWVEVRFSIGLHNKDLELLKLIKNYFNGVGNIVIDEKRNRAEFRVSSLTDIMTIILPHFNKYPLITQKLADFLLFKNIVEIKNKNKSLTDSNFIEILGLKSALNWGLNSPELEKIIKASNLKIKRPLVENKKIPDNQWLAGFVSGDGSFSIELNKDVAYKVGYNVKLVFQIAQHIKDEQLLNNIALYFECGRYSFKNSVGYFYVTKFSDNLNKIMPFFMQYQIRGIKLLDFRDWCKAIKIIETKNHLTQEGINEIIKIKAGMNRGR